MYYGPEFVSRAVLKWLNSAHIDTAHIDPGKPWQNGSNESFNGKFRDECLSMQWFKNRIDAKVMIEEFRRDSYLSADLATDNSAHARRTEIPRSLAKATWRRRTRALTIFFGQSPS